MFLEPDIVRDPSGPRPSRRRASPAAALWLGLVAWIAQSFATHAAIDPGLVQTHDGRSWRGLLHLEDDRVEIIDATGSTNTLAKTNLSFLVLTGHSPEIKPTQQGKGIGLVGYYYQDTHFSDGPIIRLDRLLDFSWNQASTPVSGLDPKAFSARWTGQIEAPTTDEYTFYFGLTGGGQVWLGNQPVATLPPQKEFVETAVTLRLESGAKTNLRIDAIAQSETGTVRLAWASGASAKSVIPSDRLYPAGDAPTHQVELSGDRGWLASYHAWPDFSGMTLTRLDGSLDFDWSMAVPENVRTLHQARSQAAEDHFAAQKELETFRESNQLGAPPDGQNMDPVRQAFLDRMRQAQRDYGAALRARQVTQTALREARGNLDRFKESNPQGDIAELEQQLAQAVAADEEKLEALMDKRQVLETLKNLLTRETELDRNITQTRGQLAAVTRQLMAASRALDQEVAPRIPKNFFGVRWSGVMIPDRGGAYLFHVESDEDFRMSWNDRLVLEGQGGAGNPDWTFSTNLLEGLAYAVRLETVHTQPEGRFRLTWTPPGQARAPIPIDRIQPAPPPPEPEPVLPVAPSGFPSGVVMQNGLTLECPVESGDRNTLRLGGLWRGTGLPTANLSRLHFRSMNPQEVQKLASARPGALLSNKDYVEGEFYRLEGDMLTLSSVLFGLRRLRIPNDVLAVVLKPGPADLPGWVVRVKDDSAIYAPNLRMIPGEIQFPGVPGLRIPQENIWQIQDLSRR